jgi:hypothetical protein
MVPGEWQVFRNTVPRVHPARVLKDAISGLDSNGTVRQTRRQLDPNAPWQA